MEKLMFLHVCDMKKAHGLLYRSPYTQDTIDFIITPNELWVTNDGALLMHAKVKKNWTALATRLFLIHKSVLPQ